MQFFPVSGRVRTGSRVICGGLALAAALALSATLRSQTDSEGVALRKIKEAREAGDNDRALRYANAVIELTPKLAAAYLERAQILDALGDQAGARKDADQVIELAPKWDGARVVRARLRLKGADYEGVLEDLPPERVGGETMLTLRGEALIALGLYEEGAAIFKYLMSGPFGPNTNSRYPRAMCLLGLGQTAEAVGWFEADCGDGGRMESRYQLALGYCLLGRYDQAQKHLAAWLETADGPEPKDDYDRFFWRALRDNRAEAVFLGGVVDFARGQFKESAAALEKVPPESDWSDGAQLLRHVALMRTPTKGTAPSGKESLKGAWGQSLGRFLRGELPERDLLKLAVESRNAAERRQHECQAAFYAGQKRLVAGDEFAATLLFEKAAATHSVETPEYTLATIALKPAGESPK